MTQDEEIAALRAENARLLQLFASLDWYWDAADRDQGRDSPSDILDDYDWGAVAKIERGGVVETRFMARLPPALDSDSDDNFEVDCATLKEADAAIKAELDRRAGRGGKNG